MAVDHAAVCSEDERNVLPSASTEWRARPRSYSIRRQCSGRWTRRFLRGESYRRVHRDRSTMPCFRVQDETHPVAEMTVKTTYRKETGKNYAGAFLRAAQRSFDGLGSIPCWKAKGRSTSQAMWQHSWITSENYDMTLKPGTQVLDGRECLLLAIDPQAEGAEPDCGDFVGGCEGRHDCAAGGRGFESAVGFCGSDAHGAAVRDHGWVLDGNACAGRVEHVPLWPDQWRRSTTPDYNIEVKPGS